MSTNKIEIKTNKSINDENIIIEIHDLDKQFKQTSALKNISLKIRKGEIFCIIGPNGAGKSTLIKLITGQIKATKGLIKVNNWDPIDDRKQLLGDYGLVPQELALYEELTGRENLEFHARLYNIPKDEIKHKVDEMLKVAGLSERQDDLVRNYSGGMKRRLQLVRAMLHKPEIILLDEPTLGVDVQSRNAIHEYILNIPKMGKTVVVTTNYMEEAERLSDRIVILDTRIIEGPARLQEIQEKVFPHTIFEFKTKSESLSSDFEENFLVDKLKGKLLSKRSITDFESRVQIMFETSSIEHILENFLNYAKSNEIPLNEFVLKKPTLEDIFLKLTGKEFRE